MYSEPKRASCYMRWLRRCQLVLNHEGEPILEVLCRWGTVVQLSRCSLRRRGACAAGRDAADPR